MREGRSSLVCQASVWAGLDKKESSRSANSRLVKNGKVGRRIGMKKREAGRKKEDEEDGSWREREREKQVEGSEGLIYVFGDQEWGDWASAWGERVCGGRFVPGRCMGWCVW
jgi:hypothetical protein